VIRDVFQSSVTRRRGHCSLPLTLLVAAAAAADDDDDDIVVAHLCDD